MNLSVVWTLGFGLGHVDSWPWRVPGLTRSYWHRPLPLSPPPPSVDTAARWNNPERRSRMVSTLRCPAKRMQLLHLKCPGHTTLGYLPCRVAEGWEMVKEGWEMVREGWEMVREGWERMGDSWERVGEGWKMGASPRVLETRGRGEMAVRTVTPPTCREAYTIMLPHNSFHEPDAFCGTSVGRRGKAQRTRSFSFASRAPCTVL